MTEVLIDAAKRTQFETLFDEFLATHAFTPEGEAHRQKYATVREAGRTNFAEVVAAEERQEDITDAVLLKLLPYSDNAANRANSAWIHYAPSINGNIRTWYERSGWTTPDEWPDVARAILSFVKRCAANPAELAEACQDFSASPYSKGFQAGTLSPILNALRPDDYLIMNNKSRETVNYFAGTKYEQTIKSYPALNAAAHEVVAELQDVLQVDDLGLAPADALDLFSHWLKAIKKFKFHSDDEFPSDDDSENTASMAAPFNSIFANRTEAEWAFGFLRRCMELLGVTGPDDLLVSLTLPKQRSQVIRFNYGSWVAVDLRGPGAYAGKGVSLALLTEGYDLSQYTHWPEFAITVSTDPIAVFELPIEAVKKMPKELAEHIERSCQYIRERFSGWSQSSVRRYHQQQLMDAVFDESALATLLTNGLAPIDVELDIGDEVDVDRHPPYSLGDYARETGLPEAVLRDWVEAVERKGQAILYGPPGTGKTYAAEKLAKRLVAGGDGLVELVQFHPSYTYEEFIQGIRPKSDQEGRLTYPLVPGRFLDFCRRAEQRQGTSVLIIDEINRANLARVFGELMYLLEYRDKTVPLAGGNSLRIPQRVRIIGTMNTADRSIALVDHALRRRFAFLALRPDFDVLRHFHAMRNTGFPVEALINVLARLNNTIRDPNYAVGITYFLRDDLQHSLRPIWRMEIEPYLEEYFFDQPGVVEQYRWGQIKAHFASMELRSG